MKSPANVAVQNRLRDDNARPQQSRVLLWDMLSVVGYVYVATSADAMVDTWEISAIRVQAIGLTEYSTMLVHSYVGMAQGRCA